MDLVPREYVSNAVGEVNRNLQRTYSRFHVAFTNPSFYYENSQPLSTYDKLKKELTVYVRIPVVADEHLFRIYEVLTFPVPIAVQGRTQKDVLQIVNLPTSVAMSMSQNYYVPLASSSWSGCYGQYITLCKDLPYMKKITDKTCTAALLRRDDLGIKEKRTPTHAPIDNGRRRPTSVIIKENNWEPALEEGERGGIRSPSVKRMYKKLTHE